MDFEEFTLAASTDDLSVVTAAREVADAVEFRMDLATDPLAAIEDYDGSLPVIATNRVTGEGGQAADTPERLRVLERAAEHTTVEAIDVELEAVEEGDITSLREHARTNDVRVIVSTHDFETTPDRSALDDRLAAASDWGDVGKLAVTAASPDDVLDLLAATRKATRDGRTVATMAMGEQGRHSRAVAPLYGSKIGYAPVDAEAATAPGQYDLETLAALVTQLAGR